MKNMKLTITIEPETYILAKSKIPEGQLSRIISNLLRSYLQISNDTPQEEDELKEEESRELQAMSDASSRLTSIRVKIVQLAESKKKDQEDRIKKFKTFNQSIIDGGGLGDVL